MRWALLLITLLNLGAFADDSASRLTVEGTKKLLPRIAQFYSWDILSRNFTLEELFVLRDPEQIEPRYKAMIALSEVDYFETRMRQREIFVRATKDPIEKIALCAVRALGKLKHPYDLVGDTEKVLTALLDSSNEEIRDEAAKSLVGVKRWALTEQELRSLQRACGKTIAGSSS